MPTGVVISEETFTGFTNPTKSLEAICFSIDISLEPS
jgi:hypothetical protein